MFYLILFCVPSKRIFSISTPKPREYQTDIELTTPFNPKVTQTHQHSHTIIDPIKGLCWNYGCVIVPPYAPILD